MFFVWIGDPVIGTSQLLVVTHQAVVPLGFSVCGSARLHVYDSGVRMFLKRESCLVDHHMTSECNSWPMAMERTYSMNNGVSMTQNCICYEYNCVNDMESYIL